MANPWTLFKQLLPNEREWIGKIENINTTTGKVSVSVPEGLVNNIVVGGGETYGVGEHVFIKGNTIVKKAPDLRTVVNEEVS